MDFRLTEEQRLVQEAARDFVDKEIVPHVRDWEAKGEVPRSLYAKMASLGFLGAPVPEKYGGAGMDYVSFALLVEEISRGSSSVRTTVSVQTSLSESTLMLFGSEAQKQEWLVPLARGMKFGAGAVTKVETTTKLGLRASPTADLAFEDCRVPKGNLVGKRGDGWDQVMRTLNNGRLGIAAGAVGVARAALEAAVKYAQERKAFNRP